MKQLFLFLLFFACFISVQSTYAQGRWQRVDAKGLKTLNPAIEAAKYLTYTTDGPALKSQLSALSTVPEEGQIMELPMPDGTMKNFRIWQTPLLPAPLAAKYPEIRTFTGVSVDNPGITAKLDFTMYGFHAMIYDGDNTSFVNPYDNSNSGTYMAHYKRDEIRKLNQQPKCVAQRAVPVNNEKAVNLPGQKAFRTSNGYELRTYRLALACSHQYAQAATSISTPLKSQVLSKMVTSMNRINGVYERELSITMNFVANEDLLIDTAAAVDTFRDIDGNPDACLPVNQWFCDTKIGSANYDIGHVFTTNAGGLSEIGVVCMDGSKAQSVTGQPNPTGDGFDIDYVAHEMGHEYGGSHPFNSSAGNCGGWNLNDPTAYEPGSGSTIMAYAGICDPDDLQPHSDDYFHVVSLKEIQAYITTYGDECSVKTPTNNKLVYMPPFSALYNIPFQTPFELTAPAAAVDSVADTSITYCWEEWDLGDFGEQLVNTHEYGPIFRSYSPVKSLTRVFPKNSMVLAGVLSNAGIEDNEGEKAPDTARILTFKLTVRDIFNGNGCFLVPDDSILLNVINTGAGFKVTSQNDSGAIYIGGGFQHITWNVVGTNTGAVNTPNVEIYMSDDSGNTWAYHIGTFPNSGSASVPLPNPPADIAKARIKVKGSGNVFFNVNKYNFGVSHSDGTDTLINLYPVPAHSTVRISTGNKGQQQFVIYNSAGERFYSAIVYGIYDVDVSLWPRGVYIIKLIDNNGHRTVKKFVVD